MTPAKYEAGVFMRKAQGPSWATDASREGWRRRGLEAGSD